MVSNRESTGGDFIPGSRAAVRRALVILFAGAVLTAVLLPVDGAIGRGAAAWFKRWAGDPQREVEALQQFGQLGFSVVVGLAVILLDPAWRRKILGWGVSALVVGVVTFLLKCLCARVRPKGVGDGSALEFVWAWGTYTQTLADGSARVLSPWGGHYVLESMPSRHAAFGALCAVFLMVHYPRLRWLAAGLAGVVCCGRILTGAHWPSDTAAGAAIGAAIGVLVMGRGQGKD